MKLVYFDIRGLAETSRLLFALNEYEYEDFRYPLKVIDISTYTFEKKEFEEAKENGLLVNSMNKLPYLDVDGVVISQSKAIERFLARHFDMMGETETDAAFIDSLCEYIRDFKDEYKRLKKEDKVDEWFDEIMPAKMNTFNNLLQNTEDRYSEEELTNINPDSVHNIPLNLADIIIYSFITHFFDDKERALKSIENCENIQTIINTVGNTENIKNYIENRPDSII
jgi:glutathione S-transferase